jgi:ABC-2 type transport system permease protein
MRFWTETGIMLRRELKSYFQSPIAYVFLVGFLLLVGFLTFMVGGFFEMGQADLRFFFFWHPWVYLLLVPAASMRLWAEERKSGTIELLLTLPVTLPQALAAKFLAAWLFLILALALTSPIVFTGLYLGHPDLGAIVAGYVGSALLAGAYLSVGLFASALTRNQVISFVVALLICLFLLLAGWPPVVSMFNRWAPDWLVRTVAAFGVMPYFESATRGVLDIRDIAYFLSVMVVLLLATHWTVENRKGS